MYSDTRERLLAVLVTLDKPVTVPEIQNAVEDIIGIKPDRKSIYSDIRTIERYYPLIVQRVGRGRRTIYSLADK